MGMYFTSFRIERYSLTWPLVCTIIAICLGPPFALGYGYTVELMISRKIEIFMFEKFYPDQTLTEHDHPIIFINTTALVAMVLAAAISGLLADMFGRRKVLIGSNICTLIGALLILLIMTVDHIALLFLHEFFKGLGTGLGVGPSIVYLIEIAPRNVRGVIGCCSQIFVMLGVVLAFICSLTSTMNTPYLWHIACGLVGIPTILSLITLQFCDDSPCYLYTGRRDESAAREAFLKFNIREDVDIVIRDLDAEIGERGTGKYFNPLRLFTARDLRMATLIVCLFPIQRQLSGTIIILTVAIEMFSGIDEHHKYSEYIVLGFGFVTFLTTMCVWRMIERIGRRKLLLTSTMVLVTTLVLMTIDCLILTHSRRTAAEPILIILFMVIALINLTANACGLGMLTPILIAEIFRQVSRAQAYALSETIEGFSIAIFMMILFPLYRHIGCGIFVIMAIGITGIWVVFYFYLPETNNRTFDEVYRDLAHFKIVPSRKCNSSSHSPETFTELERMSA